MINNNKKLKEFQRVSGNGTAIPGTSEFRERIPVDGKWIQVAGTVCCPNSGDINGYVLLQNTTASANITAVSAGQFIWTGTLANGQSLIIPLFSSYDYPVSVTVDTPSGRTISTAVLQGSGSITAGGAITLATNIYTTSATFGGQYSIILS